MRKLKFLIIGVLVFFTADLFFVILDLTFNSSEMYILVITDFFKLALPFSLWFIFSYDYFIKFAEDRDIFPKEENKE